MFLAEVTGSRIKFTRQFGFETPKHSFHVAPREKARVSLAKAEGRLEIMEQRLWLISHHFAEYHIMGTLEHQFILSFLQGDTSTMG